MKIEQYNPTEEAAEQYSFPKSVSLNPIEKFPSKLSPIFRSEITDNESREIVGNIDFQLLLKSKKIVVQAVKIDKTKEGYGVEVYKKLQQLYPDYKLTSSEEMHKKDSPDQDKPNAVYLWEKLVKLGLAEGDQQLGFRMK